MQIQQFYIECPHCGKWHVHTELMSYTVLGNPDAWSDGKFARDEIVEYASLQFSKCNKCTKFFWLEDCTQVNPSEIDSFLESGTKKHTNNQLIDRFLSANPDYATNNNLQDLNYPPPDYSLNYAEHFIPDLLNLLKNTEELSTQRELHLRLLLWQYINDFARNAPKGFIRIFKSKHNKVGYDEKMYKSYKETRLENLNRLLELLQKAEGPDYEDTEIRIIEIERELGNFEKAKTLIENLDPIIEHNHKAFVNKSLKLIAKKRNQVFMVN